MQIKNKSIRLSNALANRSFNEETSSFRSIFMSVGDPTIKALNLNQQRKFRGDFHGLLASLGITPEFHQIITQINGFSNTTDFTELVEEIIIPDVNSIQSFISTIT